MVGRFIVEQLENKIDEGLQDFSFPIKADEPKIILPMNSISANKGPSQTPPKETKRAVKKLEIKANLAPNSLEPKDNIRPLFEIPESSLVEIGNIFGKTVLTTLRRTVEVYKKGGGVIKILKNLNTENDEHILSLRVGREYRALFAIGENNQGELISFYHRRDQDQAVAKYRR